MSKSLATKNVAAVVLAFAMIVGFAFAFATPAKADMMSDLQAQVQALLAQISSLQGGSMSSGTMSGAGCYTFTQSLKKGSTGGEVMWVQKFLNNHGVAVTASGAGSMGNETSTFGPATAAAVKKFQQMYAADILTPVGLTAGTGNWGPSTRAKANALCAGSMTGGTTGGGTTVPTGPGISVSAGVQPANSLAPAGASRVPFTTFKITNNSSAVVTINGVNVMRTGLADDAVFNNGGIILVDENGTQLGVQRTLNSDDTVVAGDPFTINPGQTKTITVSGNMNTTLTSFSGQVVSLAVTGIMTSAPVSGTLPITGASQTINSSLTVGSVTAAVSSFDPNSASTKNIGDSAVKFAGVRFTASSVEDLKLYSVRFRLNGTVSASDLSNMTAVVDGTSYPVTVSADGRYFTVAVTGGLLIQKGFSKDLYIQGDITGSNASGRIVEFDVDRKSDVYIVGQTFGYGVQPDNTFPGGATPSSASTHSSNIFGSGTTAAQPWFQGSTVSVSGASITTIGKANEVAAGNVAVNVPNQNLGGFATDLKGEGISVTQMVFDVASTSLTGLNLTNVSLVNESGAVVAGPVDATQNVTASTITFTNSVNFPVGRHVYTLKGKINANATDGSTIIISTTPSSEWTGVTGLTTGNSVLLTNSGVFSMNTMTVRAASLSASVSATPAAQTVTAGSADFVFANIQLDASQSGEDVRVSNLPIGIVATSTSYLTNLTSCRVYDGATSLTTGGNIYNPTVASSSISFDNSLTVAKGTVKTLSVKCNISSNTPAGIGFIVGIGTASFNATGITSSNTVTVGGTTGGGQLMTIGSASLAVSLDSSSPSAVIAAGGSTGVTLGAYKFRATNDGVSLNRIGLVLTSGSVQDLTNVKIYQGSTLIGTVLFVSSHATSTLSTPLVLAKDVDTVITIKGDIAAIGTSQPGTSGDTVKVDIDTNGTNTQGTGVGSGAQVNATGSSAVSGVRIYRSFPTVAQDTLSTTGVTDGKLIRFKVTANSAGSIGIDQISWIINYSGGSVTLANVKLYAFSDSSYSTPVSGSAVANDGQVGSTVATYASGAFGTTTVSGTSLVQVSGGATVFFELRADITGTTGISVVTKIRGDATAAALGTADSLEAAHAFIWSPNTAGESISTTAADATNGATVIGLPSAGFTQARGL